MEKMKMKSKTLPELTELAKCIQYNFDNIQDFFARHGGVVYVINGKYRFLGFKNWVWDLQNRDEITELLDELDLMDRPRRVAKYYIVSAVCESLGRRKALKERTITAPISRRPGSKIAEYREDLRQYILNTYYPIN
jgi:hypothetical protein